MGEESSMYFKGFWSRALWCYSASSTQSKDIKITMKTHPVLSCLPQSLKFLLIHRERSRRQREGSTLVSQDSASGLCALEGGQDALGPSAGRRLSRPAAALCAGKQEMAGFGCSFHLRRLWSWQDLLTVCLSPSLPISWFDSGVASDSFYSTEFGCWAMHFVNRMKWNSTLRCALLWVCLYLQWVKDALSRIFWNMNHNRKDFTWGKI